MSSVLARYESRGFRGQFSARPGAQVRCLGCMRDLLPSAVGVQAIHRLEGSSDPDDMAAVAALECPACHQKGTIVLTYGPSGSPNDGSILKDLHDERGRAGSSGLAPGV
ncbi:MAG: hypothetical protein QOD77_1369 [Thermoplasmata archaeon]|nr:hypothetical protein [Thermoplasmata archaeon]